MVSFVRNFNSSEHRAEFKDLFKNFCELYYPVSTDYQDGPCPVFVESIFYIFNKIDPVNHCDQIGACGSLSVVPVPSNDLPERASNIVCDVCEQVLGQIQTALEQPETVEEFKRRIDAFCDYLKVVDQDKQCKQIMNNYLEQAMEFVRNLNPKKYCQAIQLCKPSDKDARPTELPTPSLAHFNNFGIETSVTIGGQVVKDLSATKGLAGPNCMFCKTFVRELFKFLRENRTEENIRHGLDQICLKVFRHGPNFEQCKEMVDAYAKELVTILVDETDPEMVCMLLEQCAYKVGGRPIQTLASTSTKSAEPIGIGELISMLDPSIKPGSLEACVECKIFLNYVRDRLSDTKSQDEIENWLLVNLCNSLEEKQLKDSCTRMVQNYSQVFFETVVSELDPKAACIELKACRPRQLTLTIDNSIDAISHLFTSVQKSLSPAPAAAKVEGPSRRKDSQTCEQCVDIITRIDEYLSSHSIDHDVDVLVNQVCDKLLDESTRAECTLLVKTFGTDIVQAISTMDNPRQFCTKIAIC